MEQLMLPLQSLLGIIIIPALAWAISENRSVAWSGAGIRFVAGGIALQFVLVALLLHMPWTPVSYTHLTLPTILLV